MAKKQKKKADEYEFVTINVDSYDVRTEAGTNVDVRVNSPHVISDDTPIYEFYTVIDLYGVITYPESRSNADFKLTIYGSEKRGYPGLTLKDTLQVDSEGMTKMVKKKGAYYPVYNVPPGIATLEKVRGENRWHAWIFAAPDYTRDSLILLSSGKKTYVSIHERKVERRRWIQSLSLQTTDPLEE